MVFRCLGIKREWHRTKGLTMLKQHIRVAALCSAFSFALASNSFAADLPTANEMFAKMGFGINIGNTMEVPQNPTWWGNKFPTEAYIDSVKAAGFSTIRIPCAWYYARR